MHSHAHPDREAYLATESQPISPDRAAERFSTLIGLPVSRAWLGYGAALFLDLRQLVTDERGRTEGEAGVMLDCDWILGGPGMGLIDRGHPEETIVAEMARLTAQRVASIQLVHDKLSLDIRLERGQWIRTLGRDVDGSS